MSAVYCKEFVTHTLFICTENRHCRGIYSEDISVFIKQNKSLTHIFCDKVELVFSAVKLCRLALNFHILLMNTAE